MGQDSLQLIEPVEGMRGQYLEYIDEFRAAGEAGHSYWRDQVLNDFDAFVQKCRDEAAGRRFGWHGVPITSYWLTCDKDNIASARVIQKNGGVLESEYWWEEHGAKVMVQRYWIDLK